MFQTDLLSIIRSISTLYTLYRYLSFYFCWLPASVVSSILTTLADSQQNQHDKYLWCAYSVEIPLMTDRGSVRNMQSTLSKQISEIVHLVGFYYKNLFEEVLYMFQTDLLSIIRSISTLYTRYRHLSFYFCWLPASVASSILTTLAGSQQNQHDKYLWCVYSVEIPLMTDGGSVRNMQSTLSKQI